MRLHDLLDGLDSRDDSRARLIEERRGGADVEVRSVVHDSRDATAGAMFCCIRGAVTDGHTHAAAAVDAGAVALLVEETLPLPVPQVRVASVRRALGPVAARFHGDPSRAMRVLGVTGTNGKTTTTYLLDAIARATGERTGVIGTVGTRIGDDALRSIRTTPEATDLQALLATMRDAGVQSVAMEVSSHALDQHRVDATRFAATCFTNLTHDHLDYHHTLDAYFDAKARLFTPAFAPVAAFNVDDDHGRRLRERASTAGVEVVSYAINDTTADVIATDVRLAADHTSFTLRAPGGDDARVRLPLVGPFNVANALAAAATAVAAGFRFDAIAAGLGAPIVVPGRMERVDAGQPFVVLVDYAHTPDALERVLIAARTLAVAPNGRVIVVYGCGGDRDTTKRPLMGAVASRRADVAYLTSDNPRSEAPEAIAREVLAGVAPSSATVVELDRRAAIRDALRHAESGDVIVIAGKGHETGQTVLERTLPFDDRLVAREELEALSCT